MRKKVTAILLVVTVILSMGSAACAAQADVLPVEAQNIAAELQALAAENGDPAEGGAFSDVAASDYYFDAVNWAVENQITQGMGNGLFMPADTCTRAQVVTFLWRLDGETAAASGENSFSDVETGSWYADAVLWAVERKVTDGMGNGIFLPDGTCTRAQIVTFLWKYAGKPAVTGGADNPFADVDEDDWYADAVLWAVDQGITTGLTERSFGPEEPCTRAQIVTFLHRYDNAKAEEPPVTDPEETKPVETEPSPTEPDSGEEDWSGGIVPIVPKPSEPTTPPSEPDSGEENWGGGAVEPPVTEPTNPEPEKPAPTEPEPEKPAPTEPEQEKPTPTEPEPEVTEPSATQPEATEPSVTQPAETEPGEDWGGGDVDVWS